MSQMSLFQPDAPPTWSVTDLTRYMRELLESDHNLTDLWITGEVSNVSTPKSGHLYFTLKDANASLKCVMWKPQVMRLRFPPRDGDAIEVHGALSIYEQAGQYQLYADLIRQTGEGALYQEFMRLKAKLENAGLFDEDRKRPIPAWPQTIGLVTSPTGAALQDMLNTIRRRYPLVRVILAPTAVQGIEAPPGIIRSLTALAQQMPPPDIIIVARGGGSIEDLWAFNDEFVVRAVATSPIPVISGVGHETDFTLTDFAADLRAPTPTAAAELATPNQTDLRAALTDLRRELTETTLETVNTRRWNLSDAQNRLLRQAPRARILNDRQRLDDLTRRAETALNHRQQLHRTRLDGLTQKLTALNPLAILERGYAVVTQADGQVVRRVSQVSPGDPLTLRLADGTLPARAE
ncbi:MAG: exodeoxyribonuclease VII large subunit [Anaerolineales bacterium]|nr:exodeoxyribonuclease VII large subunit [Anaerolineales bacterium]